MNAKNLISIVTLLFIFSVTSVSAQNWNKLKNKAKSKAKTSVRTKTKKVPKKAPKMGSVTEAAQTATFNEEYDNFVKQKRNLIYESAQIGWETVYSPLDPSELKGIVDARALRDSAIKLDYPNTLAKLQEKGKIGLKATNEYDAVVNYGDKFKAIYDESLENAINRYIDEGLKAKQQRNDYEAVDNLQKGLWLAEACVLVIPELEAKVKPLREELQKNYDQIAPAYYDKIYQNDFHKNHIEKIMFSTKPVVIGDEDPAQFSNEFSIKDNIYGMAYFSGTIKHITNGGAGQFYVTWDGNKDGASYTNILFGHNKQDYDNAFNVIDIIPAADKAFHAQEAKDFARILAALSPRKHTIQIQYLSGSRMIAYGEFTIDLSGMNPDKLKQNAETACSNAQDNWAKHVKLPKDFSQTSQKFSDPELSQANMKKILQKKWANCAQITKVVVFGDGTADDWYVMKNDLDIPVNKQTRPRVGVVYKGKDGWCYFVKEVIFAREYLGGGKYSAVKFFADSSHTKLDCKNVK